MTEQHPWADLSRALFSGAPMPAAEATPAAPAAAEAPPEAPTVDPFRQWVDDTKAQQAKATAVERIAAAHNVPAAALVGNTPEELTEHAQALRAMMHPTDAPIVSTAGTAPNMNPGISAEDRAVINLLSAPHRRI